MLSRPGSTPGSGWMKNVSERLASGPADRRSVPPRYWLWYIALMALLIVVLPMALRRSVPPIKMPTYESSLHIAGLPAFAYGQAPVAIIAVGGRPRGVVAIGGIAVGLVAIGGLAAGGLAFGGVSFGVFALAGLAVGWKAVGGAAIGYRTFGGLAAGGYAYAGNGIAYGYHEASGRQKERLFG